MQYIYRYKMYNIYIVYTHIHKPSRKRGKIINISEHVKTGFLVPAATIQPPYPPKTIPPPTTASAATGAFYFYFFKYPALVPHKRPYIYRMALHIPGRRAPPPTAAGCCFPPSTPRKEAPRPGRGIWDEQTFTARVFLFRVSPGGNRARAGSDCIPERCNARMCVQIKRYISTRNRFIIVISFSGGEGARRHPCTSPSLRTPGDLMFRNARLAARR